MKKKRKIFPSKELGNLTSVLYSVSQDCFHIESLFKYVENNIHHGLLKLGKNDYRLIGVCTNDMDADGYIEHFKELQEEAKKVIDKTKEK